MKTINKVTSALSSSRYEWPNASTRVTQYGPHSVGIDIDLSELEDQSVHTFINQFRSYVHFRLGDPVRVVTHVGAVEVEILVTVSKEFTR